MKEIKKNDRRQNAFGLKHLKIFFNNRTEGYPDPKLNRRVISKIINNNLLTEIIFSQIPQSHRVCYLVACKIYALRCRNVTLASRIQTKWLFYSLIDFFYFLKLSLIFCFLFLYFRHYLILNRFAKTNKIAIEIINMKEKVRSMFYNEFTNW